MNKIYLQYYNFIIDNKRFLTFGFLLMFFSSFGQTFFISLFSKEIRLEFSLSHGEFGYIYSAGTLLSGITIIWIGKLIDHIKLKIFTLFTFVGLIVATIFISKIPSALMLFPAIYFLRLFGQGLMSHTAMTSVSSYFDINRGKALSIVILGLPIGEAILPLLTVILISIFGWRDTWSFAGLILILASIPILTLLLKNHSKISEDPNSKKLIKGENFKLSIKNILKDSKFYIIAFSIISPPFILTGLFFHQVHIADSKGWSLIWLASTFLGYSITTIFASLISGNLIDKYGAYKILPYYLLPLSISLILIILLNHPIIAIPYMIFAGATIGIGNTLTNAIWAEIYGIKMLGAIMSISLSVMVLSSSLSPIIFGVLLDIGVNIEKIAFGCLVYILISTLFLFTSTSMKKNL